MKKISKLLAIGSFALLIFANLIIGFNTKDNFTINTAKASASVWCEFCLTDNVWCASLGKWVTRCIPVVGSVERCNVSAQELCPVN